MESSYMTVENEPQETPCIDRIFPIKDEEWQELRYKIKNTTDLDYMDWIYGQLGELELDLAYSLHVLEERWAQLKQ
jgi:hypothetical protein